MISIIPFDFDNNEQIDWIAALWNSACGESLPISTRFVHFNTRPTTGGARAGRIALDEEDRPVGFVLASALPDAPLVVGRVGWIDAIAVAPPFQRQGIGRGLLQWAEGWFAEQRCSRAVIGAGLRLFVPGVPVELHTAAFFEASGYTTGDQNGIVWDVARNLADYTPPPGVEKAPCAVRPAQPGQTADLLGFLEREFPGRWLFECQEFLKDGGRISDYMLLWTDEGVQGTCRLTFEDSAWPIERFYPYRLPRPWGQLGSIGVAEAARGQGLGLALLDGGLRRLHDNGINGCVIDWTTIIDFYGKVGFEKYRSYVRLQKQLRVDP